LCKSGNEAKTVQKTENKVPLTELKVDELKVRDKSYYVHDLKMPGLSVRVTPNGVKAYVYTKFKQKFIRITLGRVGALRLDAARIAAQKLHADLALGVDIAAERKAKERGETMQQAYERFIGSKPRRAITISSYEYLWRLHVPDMLESKPVKDVSVQMKKNGATSFVC
jgi:hypothetical protein